MAVDKLRMDFDVSKAADVTRPVPENIIEDIIVRGNDFEDQSLGRQYGIKYKEKLIDVSVGNTYIQTVTTGVGDLNPSGGTRLADKEISVTDIALIETYDNKTIGAKLAGLLQKQGSDPSNPLPLLDISQQLKADEVSRLNSLNFWQGDVTGATYNKFDGILTQCLANSGTTIGGIATGYSASNVLAQVNAFELSATTKNPNWLTTGYFIYMSPAQFDIFYRTKFGINGVLTNLNINTEAQAVTEFSIANVTYKSKVGLTGKVNLLATRKGNFVLGSDMLSEEDFVQFNWVDALLKFRLIIAYKLGGAVCRFEEVVITA
jgi:hypothetical protein